MPPATKILKRHPNSRPLGLPDIRKTSRATAAALLVHNIPCCLFGSAACSMYGMRRVPNDIDMVVLTDQHTPEDLKALIADTDPKFFLVKSRTPGATWKILYYTLPNRGFCKADILLPGILSIPTVPIERIRYTRVPGAPVMPIVAVILLKLQGWTDHRDSEREDFQEKQWVDIDDIRDMLNVWAKDHRAENLHTEQWMPADFVDAGQGRVIEFLEECPDTVAHWRVIGLMAERVPVLSAPAA
ncbi:hypothetical protein HWV62_15305 [Athelia sp. TMB]|nr:hypothetical protein HWV62_15305 [Athelia sp. TMB]